MAEKRIIEYEAASELANDDWLLIDGVTEGTRKARPNVVTAELGAQVTNIATAVGGLTQVAMGHEQSFAPSYDESASYDVGDLVMQYHCLYRCTAATTGTWDAGKWARTEVSEQLEESGKIDDVQVNGVSVVTDKVAEIDLTADNVTYDNTTSELEAENVQDAIDEVASEIEDIQTDVDNKADVDGMYEELFAGNLVTDMHTADNSPYIYRQSPTASSVSQNIVGGTVAWNQLIPEFNSTNYAISNVTASYSNGVCTFTAQAQNGLVALNNKRPSIIAGHKYFCGITIKSASNTTGIKVRWASGNKDALLSPTTNWTTYNYVITTTSSADISNFNISDTKESGFVEVSAKGFMFIDLTQAFGSTIADYIYTLEQAEAGSGIAWLKSYGFLTKDYYAYDSGSLQSVNVSARKVVGFNQWDEEWIIGYYRNGIFVYGTDSICCKNKIRVKPNTTYYLYKASSANLFYTFYDANGLFLSLSGYDSQGRYQMVSSGAISVPNDAYYMTFNMGSAYGSTYNNDICINISDASKNGQYEPYTKHTYPLDSDLTLRGIPKLDANNNLYYDGDVYNADGSVKRKYGVVDLGSLSWQYNESLGLFYASFTGYVKSTYAIIPNIICTPFVAQKRGDVLSNNVNGITLGNVGEYDNRILIRASNIADLTAFNQAVNGVYLIYELATPTSDSANPYSDPQLVGSTEEFVDVRDVQVPVGGERKYYTDLKAKLEELAKIPDVPSTNGTYTLKATRSATGVVYSWVNA